MKDPIVKIAAAIVVLIFGLILFVMSVHKVPTGHAGVVSVFGKVQHESLTEGIHFLNPIARVHDIDCRQDVYTIDGISFPSQDQLTSQADISVKWRIDFKAASELYQNTGDRAAIITRHLEPKIRSLVREASRSVKTAEEFFDNATQQRIQTTMSEAVISYMHPKGIIVEEVMVRDVVLPRVIQEGVTAKKVREQKAQEQEAELARFKTEQQQQVEKAKADKEASEMEAEKTKIVADAKAYAFRTEAEAKARALQIEGESIRANPDVIKMRAVETWDGSLPKFFGGNADFLFTPEMLLNPKQ